MGIENNRKTEKRNLYYETFSNTNYLFVTI